MYPENFSFRNTRHNQMELMHVSAALFVMTIQHVFNPFSVHHVQLTHSRYVHHGVHANTRPKRCDMPFSLIAYGTFSLAFPQLFWSRKTF